MDNLNNIKDVWLTAKVEALPTAFEILKTIKRHRFSHVIKRGILITLSVLLAVVMIYVVFFYHSNLLVTRIGEACIFIAIFILLATNANALTRIQRWRNYTNNEYIDYLKEVQLRQLYFHKKTMGTGFILASAGLLLYLFEIVYQEPTLMLVVYFLAVAWILFNWFIIRPWAIRRKLEKLNATIGKLERLSSQLSNNYIESEN